MRGNPGEERLGSARDGSVRPCGALQLLIGAPGGIVLLAAGAAILVGLWAGPLPEVSAVSFTAHMGLHLGVVLVAAPLIALGLARCGTFRRVRFGVGAALGFSAVEMIAVWSWHAPALHTAAALHLDAFVLQQASFLVAGLLVWLPGLADGGRRAAAAGAMALAASFTHMTMLGVLLAIAPASLYPDGVCGGAFGLDPITDQRVGGIMMALVGGFGYLGGAVWFAARLLFAEPARSAR